MFNLFKRTRLARRDFFKIGAAASAAGSLSAQDTSQPTLAGAKCYALSGPAKAWNLPQRKSPPISIDVHTHWAPEGYRKMKVALRRPDNSQASINDMEARMRWMDQSGVAMQVVTLGGFMPWEWIGTDDGRQIARICNDAALEVHNKYPDRFLFGIEVPARDPEGSLAELNRVAKNPGMAMLHLPNSLAGREFLFGPDFAPVLARCEELNLPLFIHPLDGEPNWYEGHRLADEYSGGSGDGNASMFPGLTNSLGETFEQATTAAKFISSGTLDKYPNLTVIFGHAAGAFPFVSGRVDWRTPGLKHPVTNYLRRFYYDSQAFYPVALKFMVDLVGSDRVILGTDSMGAGNGPGNPHSVIDQANFPEPDRDLILRGNLKKLFRV